MNDVPSLGTPSFRGSLLVIPIALSILGHLTICCFFAGAVIVNRDLVHPINVQYMMLISLTNGIAMASLLGYYWSGQNELACTATGFGVVGGIGADYLSIVCMHMVLLWSLVRQKPLPSGALQRWLVGVPVAGFFGIGGMTVGQFGFREDGSCWFLDTSHPRVVAIGFYILAGQITSTLLTLRLSVGLHTAGNDVSRAKNAKVASALSKVSWRMFLYPAVMFANHGPLTFLSFFPAYYTELSGFVAVVLLSLTGTLHTVLFFTIDPGTQTIASKLVKSLTDLSDQGEQETVGTWLGRNILQAILHSQALMSPSAPAASAGPTVIYRAGTSRTGVASFVPGHLPSPERSQTHGRKSSREPGMPRCTPKFDVVEAQAVVRSSAEMNES